MLNAMSMAHSEAFRNADADLAPAPMSDIALRKRRAHNFMGHDVARAATTKARLKSREIRAA